MKHTAAPWTADDNGHIFANGKRTLIATVHKDMEGFAIGLRRSERDANVRLIGVAPELLAALKDARESLKRLPDVDGAYRITCIQQADKAIAKATL